VKIGDLVRCKEGSLVFGSDIDSGIGIVIMIESSRHSALSICVQWPEDFLWYEEEDLEIVSESR